MTAADPFEPPRAFFEFRILRPLGSGAMGEVFLADDELLGRPVAIKFVRQAEKAEMRARFLLEARALARLQHPNVVTVHRVGEVLGRPFLVSEWVKGQSLDKIPLPLPMEKALPIAVQLARALAAVHRVGVLHRDLKPANVLLADSGELKLVDFGVSAELEEEASPPASGFSPSLAATQPLPGAGQQTPRQRAALQVGTPLYSAPELLSGAPGSRHSDLYGWGAVLYELCTGRPPYQATSLEELRAKAEAGRFTPLPNVVPVLAALVHRALSPRPEDRPARAEALLEALEPLLFAAEGPPLPEEPYRGLSVFGPEHAGLFFGREREIRAVLERLRAASFVLVAGDSGVGKSSLCRAGVLPHLHSGGLERLRRFQVIEASLGTRPLDTLGAALVPWLGMAEGNVAAALRSEPEQLAVRLRDVPSDLGRVLFIDGLEELVALASVDDAECVARFLGALALRNPGFRFLATARSDYLTRLSALPSLGPEVGTALHLLRPLSDEGLRQAIEGPARASGFRFEPESLVDELVAAARVGPGALPLVQFALGELWRKRNPNTKVIAGDALAAIGGVSGALARHADDAVAALPLAQRAAAEAIFRRLVSAQGTRVRRSRRDLPPGEEVTRALAALTSARLLISREGSDPGGEATYELAHEALIQGWDQLRAWLGQDAVKRAAAQRVEKAAEEWERLGGDAEGLWSRRQLRELDPFPELEIGELERKFLAASRVRARRRLALRLAGIVSLPALVTLVLLGARWRAQAANRDQAGAYLREAGASLVRARELDREEAALLPGIFARFDAGDPAEGERGWARARELRAKLEQALASARGSIDAALLLAPGAEARNLLADLIVLRLERERGNPLSRDRAGLLAQLAPIDPSRARRAPFEQPARVRFTPVPASERGWLRPAPGGDPAPVPLEPGIEREVKPGSYVLHLSNGARLPLLLRFGERRELRVPLVAGIPEGFIHVPAGRFLTGFDGDEDVRLGFFGAPPQHELEMAAFAIARTEVTFAQWMEYLRAQPGAERARRMPRSQTLRNGLALTLRPDNRFELVLKPTTLTYRAIEGEPLIYPGRRRNRAVDWRRCPVSGISFEDARAYAAWLASTGRVPGARLCSEEEWERAARGADGRSFPSGDTLSGDDANIDETYQREPLAFGPDPVGSHPRSDSPIGAADMAGNAYELTVSRAGTPVIRGGSWYQGALTARSVNREPYERTARDPLTGFRLCTDLP